MALVEAVLEAFTDPGDPVFEPFCGSGTQLIAAERTGRRCCAVELDPVYVTSPYGGGDGDGAEGWPWRRGAILASRWRLGSTSDQVYSPCRQPPDEMVDPWESNIGMKPDSGGSFLSQ